MTEKRCKKGFKRKGAKCVRIRKTGSSGSKKFFSRKSKNPFKLWGSYVGAILFTSLVAQIRIGPFATSDTFIGSLQRLFDFPVAFGLFLIIGFLIGWGIHALILMRK